MKRHLTEKEIIEYQFKLVGEERREEISAHLAGCGLCKKLAEQLSSKFTSLDLLKEETKVPDELISKSIFQFQMGHKSRVFVFRKPVWFGAAAAVVIIGVLVLVADWNRDAKKPGVVVKDDVKTSGEMKHNKPAAQMLTGNMEMKAVAGRLLAAEAAEEAPFAPASRIELVTLPWRDNVQLTIYNSADMTLVREKRNLTLKKGWNWLQFMWANTLIDPTSLSLTPREQGDKIDIQQLVYPAGLKDVGRWLIKSEVTGKAAFEITYFTSGLSWRAFYMGTLSEDERKMRLQAYVRVENGSGEDYEDAQTRLIVGKVHQLDEIAELARRQYPYGRPGAEILNLNGRQAGIAGMVHQKINDSFIAGGELALKFDEDVSKPKEIIKEGLSEYFLYTIEGTETIPDKWGKRLMSFDVNDIKVESLYKYDEERWGGQAIRFVSFSNNKEHNLGQTPLPNGTMRIYGQADSEGQLSYVGRTNVKYIPVDEEVELNLGGDRLVTIEPVLMDFKTGNYVFNKKGNVAGWDEIRNWKIDITNTRQLPIEIEVTRGFETAYWRLDCNDKDVTYEKYDVRHARFKLKAEPRSKKTFTYTVTTYHGVREEALTEMEKNKN